MIISVVKKWAVSLKNNIFALYVALKDKRVPKLAKIIIGLVVFYALSPIDLIPDFIPIIGYLDDLLLLPLGIWVAIRLIPKVVWYECKLLSAEQTTKLPQSRGAAIVIISIWFMALVGFSLWLWPFFRGIDNAN